MGVQAWIFGQKRWVDVQHFARKLRDEFGRKDAHKPRKADDIGLSRVQMLGQRRLKGRAGGKAAMIQRGGHQAKRRGQI